LDPNFAPRSIKVLNDAHLTTETAPVVCASLNHGSQSPTRDNEMISPRLFPAFKPSPALKMHTHHIQDLPQCEAMLASVDTTLVENNTADVAAAALHLTTQIQLHAHSAPALQHENNVTLSPFSSQLSHAVLRAHHEPHLSACSRSHFTPAATRPSTSGSVSLTLPSAPSLQRPDSFEVMGCVSNSSVCAAASHNPTKLPAAAFVPAASDVSPSTIPVVPPLDMRALHVFKRQQAHSGRGNSLRTTRILELSLASAPPPSSSRGCSGRKLVSGVPVSKAFAEQRQQQKNSREALGAASCLTLSARRPVPPSHPRSDSTFSERFMRGNMAHGDDDETAAICSAYQEFDAKF
jgi:hypothetical protein